MATQTKERPILFNGDMVRAILAGKTQTRRFMKSQPIRVGTELRFGWSSFFDNGVVFTWDQDGTGGENWNANQYPKEKPINAALERAIAQGFMVPPLGVPGDRLWVRETFATHNNAKAKKYARNESRNHERPCGYAKYINRLCDEPNGEDFLEYVADGERVSLGEWEYPHPIYDFCIGRFSKNTPSIHMPRWASRITLEITDVRVERLRDMTEEDAKAEGFKSVGDFVETWDEIYEDQQWSDNPWVWVYEFKRLQQAEVTG